MSVNEASVITFIEVPISVITNMLVTMFVTLVIAIVKASSIFHISPIIAIVKASSVFINIFVNTLAALVVMLIVKVSIVFVGGSLSTSMVLLEWDCIDIVICI
ncbi:hypothetical protein FISHEDRAFT_73928 [Fistulina hepatica ATCC 64428]|uniref:Uncharacterized protein n=1 Tax=Fistulina hepatica ATCC 64428 TaxID=1128425 RepID=A0A0D7AE18_9AGAR|nr:hypothetical protein FISHEDRAFT_73928 [Fistulina hepatica ATCC 64428]